MKKYSVFHCYDRRLVSNGEYVVKRGDTLYKIADALDVSVDWLLGRTNEPVEFHATEIEDEFKPQVKILYRALKDGSKPSTSTLMMLAEAIIREREEAEKEQGGKDG